MGDSSRNFFPSVVLDRMGFLFLSESRMISTSALMVVGPGRVGLLVLAVGRADMVTMIGLVVDVVVFVVVEVMVVLGVAVVDDILSAGSVIITKNSTYTLNINVK